MRKVTGMLLALFATYQNTALAAMKPAYLCENVSSVYYSDPAMARSMVINYNATSGELVFLRCGLSDEPSEAALSSQTQAYPCGIYRRTTVQGLCNEEVNFKNIRRLPTELGEAAVKTVVTGGIGLIGIAGRTFGVGKTAVKPECEGTQLVVALLNGSKVGARTTEFKRAQAKLKPFREWALLAEVLHISALQFDEGYVFERLDNFVNSNYGHRVTFENNLAYLYAHRDNQGTDQLDLQNAAIPALCQALGSK